MFALSWQSLLILCVALLLQRSDSKVISGKAYATPGKIAEISKFSFGRGTGTFEANLTYYDNIGKGKIYLFMDTIWYDEFHAKQSCEKVKKAHATIPLGAVGRKINTGLGRATGRTPIDDNRKITWNVVWTIDHHVRTYGWYVVIADCSHDDEGRQLPKKNKRKRRHKVEYEMSFINAGGSHLSQDEKWIGEVYFLDLLVLAGAGMKLWRDFKRVSVGAKLHAVVKIFMVVYILQVVSICFELIHQVAYSYNGYGIWFFDFLSELVEGFGQTILCFMLISIAHGWTLSSGTGSKSSNGYPSTTEMLRDPTKIDFESPLVLFIMVFTIISTILQVVNKVYDDSFMKFHDHETVAGFFLLFMRAMLGIVYVHSFMQTIVKEEEKGNSNLASYMRSLAFFGGLWFFAFPLVVMFATLFAHYLRHFFVTAGVLLIQTFCLIFLMYQFLSNRSSFTKYSKVSTVGLLPMGGLGGGYPISASKLS